MFIKILIANCREIAARVIVTACIKTVALYPNAQNSRR